MHLPSRQGITGIDMPPLIAVTGTATQTYVGYLGLTTRRFWDDVNDLQRHAEQLLWAMAVGTARLRKLCTQCSAEGKRNGAHPPFPVDLCAVVRWSRRNRALVLFPISSLPQRLQRRHDVLFTLNSISLCPILPGDVRGSGRGGTRHGLETYETHDHAEHPYERKGRVIILLSAWEPGCHGPVRCRERLGARLKFYDREAACTWCLNRGCIWLQQTEERRGACAQVTLD
jgi:hypothetical protein